MSTIKRRISDIGSSNPIIARLFCQTNNLIEPFSLVQKQKVDIQTILGEKVGFRLVKCEKIYTKIKEVIDKINEMDFSKQLQSSSIEVPYIIGLEQECSDFLYQAKLALRDLCKLINVFYKVELNRKEYIGSNFSKYRCWACDYFGKDDSLCKGIQEEESWIKRIIDMRNAIEHPDKNIELKIQNVELINKVVPPYFKEPKWYLSGEKESPIVRDMKVIIENILSFSEELLIILLSKMETNLPIIFIEIPKEKRNKSCPIRIKTGIDSNRLKMKE